MGTESPPTESEWMRVAVWLVVSTMAYNVVEAVVAVWSGVAAGSVALIGFGLDSAIETAAAVALLWRLRVEARGASPEVVQETEQRVYRFVGWTFVALSLYITVESVETLWSAAAPRHSAVGIALAGASLVIMPLVSWGKLRAARELGSASLRAEAKETLACSYLSFTLLAGLVANAAWGWWWADPIAALAMVPWLVREGLEGIRGEECCEEEAPAR